MVNRGCGAIAQLRKNRGVAGVRPAGAVLPRGSFAGAPSNFRQDGGFGEGEAAPGWRRAATTDQEAAMRLIRRHLSYANVASTLALVFAMGGGAYAALVPVHNGVIHTCVRTSTGALRVARAGARCGRHERALAFNQRGPLGRRGATGAPGPVGKTGSAGKTGRTGAAGRSVTSATLGVGNATCPSGGSSFITASGTTFACNAVATSFASVDAGGTLATSRSVIGVEPGAGTGTYCVKLASTPSVGVASVRGNAGSSGSAQVLIPAASAACSATGDTSAEVLTFGSAGTAAALPFNVIFG